MNPTNRGLRAAPVVRATPVNPPAADRSSAGTTAINRKRRLESSSRTTLRKETRTMQVELDFHNNDAQVTSGTFANGEWLVQHD
jgi:hypothetical protein